MKTFHCDRCGLQVFFENVRCERCRGMLGYQPEHRAIATFEPFGNGGSAATFAPVPVWRSLNPAHAGLLYRQCVNYATENVCNWMLSADSHDVLCASCKLTLTIPAASGQNRLYWGRLEAAKRRLLYSLWELGLQPVSKHAAPETGLGFRFLQDLPNKRVITGHANGVITLNIAEADPAFRERTREQMHEPYRTLLGHFRHESGHYYFDRLIVGSSWIEPFRSLFGDERQDYQECLQMHYRDGPPADWHQRYISGYASTHPWEDWAETWAHYLHMIDTLDTAFACGMTLRPKKSGEPALAIHAQPLETTVFKDLMADWFALTYVLNSLNRSVGMPDPYPFALSPTVVEKLGFVHRLILTRYRVAKAAEKGAAAAGERIAL